MNCVLYSVLVVVVAFLSPDIQNHADRQEIQIRHGQADFEAAQEKQRSGYLAGAGLIILQSSMQPLVANAFLFL